MNQLLLRLLHIANDGYQASFLLLLPFIAKDLSIDLGLVGLLGSLFYVFEIICALPAGYLAEKVKGARVLLGALTLYGLAYFFVGFSTHYSMVATLFAVAGIGFGLFHPIAFALVASAAASHKRGREMGDFTAVGDLGRIGLSTLITFLVVWWGWRFTSFIYGVSIGVILLIALLFTKKYTASRHALSNQPQKRKALSYASLLKNKRFLLAAFAGLFDSAASTPLFVFLPFLLIAKHIDPAILGAFAGAYFIGNFLGKSLMGRLVDKMGSAHTFITAELLMAICIGLLIAAQAITNIIILSMILGILTKGTAPTRVTMAIESVSDDTSLEKVTALLGLIVSCGTAVAPLLFGLIAKQYGIQTSFLCAGVIALIATIPAYFFKRIN